jgi:hypothetical protein
MTREAPTAHSVGVAVGISVATVAAFGGTDCAAE